MLTVKPYVAKHIPVVCTGLGSPGTGPANPAGRHARSQQQAAATAITSARLLLYVYMVAAAVALVCCVPTGYVRLDQEALPAAISYSKVPCIYGLTGAVRWWRAWAGLELTCVQHAQVVPLVTRGTVSRSEPLPDTRLCQFCCVQLVGLRRQHSYLMNGLITGI